MSGSFRDSVPACVPARKFPIFRVFHTFPLAFPIDSPMAFLIFFAHNLLPNSASVNSWICSDISSTNLNHSPFVLYTLNCLWVALSTCSISSLWFTDNVHRSDTIYMSQGIETPVRYIASSDTTKGDFDNVQSWQTDRIPLPKNTPKTLFIVDYAVSSLLTPIEWVADTLPSGNAQYACSTGIK